VTASERFAVAGDAACLLEDLGFVAVARKRGDEVTIELWKVIQGQQRSIEHAVASDPESAADLSAECVRAFDLV